MIARVEWESTRRVVQDTDSQKKNLVFLFDFLFCYEFLKSLPYFAIDSRKRDYSGVFMGNINETFCASQSDTAA